MSLFENYSAPQRARLRGLADSPEWRRVLRNAELLDRCRSEMTPAPSPPPQQKYAASLLIEKNGPAVRALIESGERDAAALVERLGDWTEALRGEDRFPISFLGLVLTLDCSFEPRCLYCNQKWLPRVMTRDDWKEVIASVSDPKPPYVYLTGGEPLSLGEEVWGDDGIVRFAAGRGCAVNVNTNAALITPDIALQMVKIGLAKLHISLDTPDQGRQADLLRGGEERVTAVLNGIYNIQIAREVLGAGHPHVHINCVVTQRNMFDMPKLVSFILEIRKVRSDGFEGKPTDDPVFRDFAFHLIPVGGEQNAAIRPTAEQWKRFYTDMWREAAEIWMTYQEQIGVPPGKRKTLEAHLPFANPFLRADHRISLDEYCQRAAAGVYWQTALCSRCRLAPTQGFVLPDGSQQWCGAHAIVQPAGIGNVRQAPFRQNILRNLHRLGDLPNEFCRNCAGATCVINQGVEKALREQVSKWLNPSPA